MDVEGKSGTVKTGRCAAKEIENSKNLQKQNRQLRLLRALALQQAQAKPSMQMRIVSIYNQQHVS